MNLLRVKQLGGGMHPREVIVEIDTKVGPEQMPIFVNELRDGRYVPIGYPVDTLNGHHLVELPSETARGAWRVWVKREDVVGEDL